MYEVTSDELLETNGGGIAAGVSAQLGGLAMTFGGIALIPGISPAAATFAVGLGLASAVVKAVDYFSGGKI